MSYDFYKSDKEKSDDEWNHTNEGPDDRSRKNKKWNIFL